jgi:glutamine cyclotransferase
MASPIKPSHSLAVGLVLLLGWGALTAACADGAAEPVAPGPGEGAVASVGDQEPAAPQPDGKAPVLGYEVVERFPHDKDAYTQGLLIVDGKLYEGTGKRGESTVRLVDLKTGKVLKKRDLDPRLFGEGLASVGGLLYQLTWKAGEAFLYDRATLRPLSYRYQYVGEGWGLTTTPDDELVMSNGSSDLWFLDPKGLERKRKISVTDDGRPVRDLNELEWIEGEIWANVWKRDRIARIDPKTGRVKSWVDLSGILGTYRVESPIEDVLNGIAYDAGTKRIYVTGKRWPYLFHIRVK